MTTFSETVLINADILMGVTLFDTLIAKTGLTDIYEKVIHEERLSSDDGLRLYQHLQENIQYPWLNYLGLPDYIKIYH